MIASQCPLCQQTKNLSNHILPQFKTAVSLNQKIVVGCRKRDLILK
jgi:hypothetical protein